ncbi:MAG: amidohydrolase family protein [Bariatricus sp.]
MEEGVLIQNGIIIDGTGKPSYRGDLRIRGKKIAEIGQNLSSCENERVISAEGLCVTPGFIDAHCHTDMYAADCPDACGKIMQGVTTDVAGLCGDSPAPIRSLNLEEYRKRREYQLPEAKAVVPVSFKEYMERINSSGNATNMALFVGNANLRIFSMGYECRPASAAEMNDMKYMLKESMEEGAFGLSTGLTYVPSMFADTRELTELCRSMAAFGGIYNSHMRNEGNQVEEAVAEVIRIAEDSGCRGHISHLKVSGLKNHGKSAGCLELIHGAADRGVPVTFDVYPYTAGSCGLRALLPPEILEKGIEGDYKAMKERENFLRIRNRLMMTDWDNMMVSCGPDRIMVSAANGHREYEGLTIAEIAEKLQTEPDEALIWVLGETKGQGAIIYHALCEDDLVCFMKDPLCTIGTDAFARNYTGPTAAGRPHPRNYGAFPRFIRKYLLNEAIMPLEKGIEKITSLPAAHFGIRDRGILKEGYEADITIFDPDLIAEQGDFMNPAIPPLGIKYVFLSGQMAVGEGKYNHILAGQVLRGDR